jgi:hypothetical protein
MMNNLQATFLFPVRNADARKQWLIASAIILASFIVLGAVESHVVAQGSFQAGFDVKGWWRVLRKSLV